MCNLIEKRKALMDVITFMLGLESSKAAFVAP